MMKKIASLTLALLVGGLISESLPAPDEQATPIHDVVVAVLIDSVFSRGHQPNHGSIANTSPTTDGCWQ